MIKQILNRLPRKKSSRSDGDDTAKARGPTSVDEGAIFPAASIEGLSDPPSRNGETSSPEESVDSGFLELLPSLKSVPAIEKPGLFLQKLELCSVMLDYTDLNKDIAEKNTKRQTLQEVAECIASGGIELTESVMEGLIGMVSANLFRALPPPSHSGGPESFDHDEEEPFLEPAWPHLQPTYEALLQFILSNGIDVKLARRYIDRPFVLRLVDLFDSEDHREREYVKIVLHRIYGKFMAHRPFIRKAIGNVFYRFIYETDRHNGISELLEILGTVINGFALPLKEEHKLSLTRALLPLHKPKSLPLYHQQLSFCVTQFVEKDPKLAAPVIRGLLKYWPITSSQKEVLFLSELELILEQTLPEEFQACMVPLFQQIGRCLSSPHFQVAERSLFLWNNEHIMSLVSQNRGVVLPLIFSALERGNASHWNQVVLGLTANTKKMFYEMDYQLFEECERSLQESEATAKTLEEKRDLTWRRLEAMAASNHILGEAVLVMQHIP